MFLRSIFLSLLFVCLCSGQSNIYALVTDFIGANTETALETVQIKSDGTSETLLQNLIYTGGSATYDGISTFDQKNQVFYFVTNYLGTFIFASDVANKQLKAPIATAAEQINNLLWDPVQDSLYISGTFENEDSTLSVLIISYGLSGQGFKELLDLTSLGFTGVAQSAALDFKNGVYYFVSYNATSTSYISNFQLSNPTNVKTVPVSCTDLTGKYFIEYLSYDHVKSRLVGVGFSSTPSLHYAFVSFSATATCTVEQLAVPQGIAISFAFDPTQQILYFGYAGSGAQLGAYNLATGNVTLTSVNFLLEDIAVSYKI